MTPNKYKPTKQNDSQKKAILKSLMKSKHSSDNFNPKLYISREITEDDVWLIKEAFDLHDANKMGILTPNDLKQALLHQKFYVSKETVYNLIAEYDEEGMGGLNFDAFIRIIGSDPTRNETTNDLKKIFRKYDRDNKGYINAKDLQDVSKGLGEKMSEKQCIELFSKLDKRGEGKIIFEDFCKLMHHPDSLS